MSVLFRCFFEGAEEEKERKRGKKLTHSKKKSNCFFNRRTPPCPRPLRAPLPRRLRRLRPGLRPRSNKTDHGPHEQGALRGRVVAPRVADRGRGALCPEPGSRGEQQRQNFSSLRGLSRRRRRGQPLGNLGRLPPLRHLRHPRDVCVPRDPLPDDRRREGSEGQGGGRGGGREDEDDDGDDDEQRRHCDEESLRCCQRRGKGLRDFFFRLASAEEEEQLEVAQMREEEEEERERKKRTCRERKEIKFFREKKRKTAAVTITLLPQSTKNLFFGARAPSPSLGLNQLRLPARRP